MIEVCITIVSYTKLFDYVQLQGREQYVQSNKSMDKEMYVP